MVDPLSGQSCKTLEAVLVDAWLVNNGEPVDTRAISQSFKFAFEAHDGQFRKYGGGPYISHPVGVALAAIRFGLPLAAVQAALLHDTIEDTDTTEADIESAFGAVVAAMVMDLTDQCRNGNRAARKKAEAERLGSCSAEVQSVKVLDMCGNTPSIVVHDPKFAVVYLEEKQYLMRQLTGAVVPVAELGWSVLRYYQEMRRL